MCKIHQNIVNYLMVASPSLKIHSMYLCKVYASESELRVWKALQRVSTVHLKFQQVQNFRTVRVSQLKVISNQVML